MSVGAYIDWIITPLSGAVIGYFTNWLAVKMLFRPHSEKRLLGKRLPFTPGLIPKEKERLANKIGETMAKNILTEEDLKAAVSSPEVMDKLTAALDGFLSSLSDGVYAEQIDNICNVLAEKTAELLAGQNAYIDGIISGALEQLKGKLLEQASAYLKSDAFAETVGGFAAGLMDKLAANDEPLGKYVPDRLTESVKRLVTDKMPDLVEFLKQLPERYPDVDEYLGNLVKKVAEDNFGTFLGIFIHYEQLYGKIKNSLFNYLDDPDNQLFISIKCVGFVNGLLDKPVAEIIKKLPESVREDAAGSVAKLLQQELRGGDVVERLTTMLAEKTQNFNLYGLIARFTPDPRDLLKRAYKALAKMLVNAIHGENTARLRELAVNALKLAVEKGGARVVASMRFDRMVEDKINAFSTREMEELVVSIADKELKAITWLGGVLGLVIGFVPMITKAFGVG